MLVAQGDLINPAVHGRYSPEELGLPPASKDGLLECDEYAPNYKPACGRAGMGAAHTLQRMANSVMQISSKQSNHFPQSLLLTSNRLTRMWHMNFWVSYLQMSPARPTNPISQIQFSGR